LPKVRSYLFDRLSNDPQALENTEGILAILVYFYSKITLLKYTQKYSKEKVIEMTNSTAGLRCDSDHASILGHENKNSYIRN
jgi:hypothetical protein